MRNVHPYIAGSLMAVAIFIICNCAGYLIVTYIGPGLMAENQSGTGNFANGATTAAVVAFSTPTPTPEPAEATPNLPPPPTFTPLPPAPLLPTVTPGGPPTSTPQPTNTIPPPATATTQPAAIPATETVRVKSTRLVDSDLLQILSHQSYVDSLGWYHIVGEVQNNADVPMEFVEVVAKLYDDANEVIGTKLTFTAPDVIFPGGKAPFDIITLRRSQWQQIREYRLQVKADAAEALLPQNLVLLNQNSYTDEEYLYVAGEVKNSGQAAALTKLIITLYDVNLNVINTNWSYVDAGVLPPGEISTFEIKIDQPTDLNNYHFRIQIEEEAVETD